METNWGHIGAEPIRSSAVIVPAGAFQLARQEMAEAGLGQQANMRNICICELEVTETVIF